MRPFAAAQRITATVPRLASPSSTSSSSTRAEVDAVAVPTANARRARRCVESGGASDAGDSTRMSRL